MAITQGDNGGGGSTTNVCPIGPQDEAGSINNILSRLTAIETILSQLLGTDITAIQLSDITQDMGTILGGSLSGSILADLFINFGRVNAWAISGSDPFIQSGGTDGSLSAGERIDSSNNIVAFSGGGQTSTSLNSVAGIVSDTSQFRTYSVSNNKGFYFTGRFGFYDFNFTLHDPVAGLRFFAGLGAPLASGSSNNADDPNPSYAYRYVLFQYSTPRGDNTFKVITRGSPVYLVPGTQTIVDTGIPVLMEHFYDMSMRCEPSSNTIVWNIVDITDGTSASGSVAAPEVYHDFLAPNDEKENSYHVGASVYNCEAGKFKTLLIHHIWAQSLDVNTV